MIAATALSLALLSASLAPVSSVATEVHVSGQSEMVVERTATHQDSYRRLPGTDEFIRETSVRPLVRAHSVDNPAPSPAQEIPARQQWSLIGCW